MLGPVEFQRMKGQDESGQSSSDTEKDQHTLEVRWFHKLELSVSGSSDPGVARGNTSHCPHKFPETEESWVEWTIGVWANSRWMFKNGIKEVARTRILF